MPDAKSDPILEILLTEVRAIRTEQSTHGERLASLETGLKSIIGNGAKGRLTLIEEAVEKLKEFKWRMIGVSAGAAAVVSLAFHFVK